MNRSKRVKMVNRTKRMKRVKMVNRTKRVKMVNKMQGGGKYEEMDEMDVIKEYYSSSSEIKQQIKNELKSDMERSKVNLNKYMEKFVTFKNFMLEVWPPPGTGPPPAPPLPGK